MAETPEKQVDQPDQHEAHSLDSPETATGSELKRTFAQTDIDDVSADAVTGTPAKRQAVTNTSEEAAPAATSQSQVDERLVLGYRIESALSLRLPEAEYESYNNMTLDDTAIEEIIAALARAKLRQEGSSPSTATRPSSSTPAQDTSTTPKVKLTFIYQEPDVPSISANLHIPDQHVELVSDEVPSSGMSLEALCDEKICAMVCEQEAYEKNTFDTDKLDLKYYKCDGYGCTWGRGVDTTPGS